MLQLCSRASAPRHLHQANATPRSPNAPLHLQPRPSSTSDKRARKRHSPLVSSRAHGQEAEPLVSSPNSFFSDSFKQALNQALDRSADSSLSSAEDMRDMGSSMPSMAALSVPKLPPAPSAQEDMLGASLEASRTSLSRLMAIRNEVDRAIEREKLQVERLTFAVDKAQKDEAYYRVLRVIQERGQSDTE